ncbi:MAG: hypothetical protein CMF22_11590 [Idiomarinaceae bacterium]|nr:hypothetical protein [Idiomarinaceae bacterium]|tara:strand:- start:74250 stop:74831 length:582 start_codon:yes stop_codon:yes gene_type:complete
MIDSTAMHSIVTEILSVSRAINQNRNIEGVNLALMSEVGELAEEIRIKEYPFHKKAGKDGIIGEAADVVIATTDMIYISGQSELVDNEAYFFSYDADDEKYSGYVLGWTGEAIFGDDDITTAQTLADMATGSGAMFAIPFAPDENKKLALVGDAAAAILNAVMMLSRKEGFDFDEFAEIITDKLEKWKTNYSN